MNPEILIPAYNESRNLQRIESELIPILDRYFSDYKITLVNDGSTDETKRIADEIVCRNEKFRAIHHKTNLGIGAALRTGYRHSERKWIVTIDSDFSYSPDQIPNLLKYADNGVDAVFGSPYMNHGLVKDVSFLRIIPSRGISILYSILMAKWLTCWTGLFRAIRRDAIQNIVISHNGFEAVAEIAVKLVQTGYKIVEFPAILGNRKHGASKSLFARDFVEHVKQLALVASKNH